MLQTTEAALQALNPQSSEDIQRQPVNVVGHSPEFHRMSKALKAFLYEHMYYSYRVVRMKKRAERFLEQVFLTLIDDPRQMPKEWQQELDDRDIHRVVADYIASMTDRSALLEYRQLFDPMARP
jgi:dGTPase